MKNAISANWVAENGVATATGFTLKGSSKGYASFMKAFNAGDQVFYSAHDDKGNREAGYATFDGSNLVERHATATLNSGVYQHQSPPKVNFLGDITIACTFNAVAFNVLWKALDSIDPDGDGNINIPPELIDGLGDALSNKADQVDLEKEIADRIAGDADLQDQIDGLGGGGAGGGAGGGMIISDSEPAEDERVNGTMWLDTTTGIVWIWDEDKWLEFPAGEAGGASSWDELTGKPKDFPPSSHTHAIEDVDGLEDQLSEIESSIGAISGQLALGASYDASTGLIVHGHIPGFEDGQPLPAYADHQDVFVIVSIAGDNPEELSEGDWLVAGPSGWVPVKYGTAGTVDWSNVNNAPEFIEDVDDDGKTYIRTYGAWQELTDANSGNEWIYYPDEYQFGWAISGYKLKEFWAHKSETFDIENDGINGNDGIHGVNGFDQFFAFGKINVEHIIGDALDIKAHKIDLLADHYGDTPQLSVHGPIFSTRSYHLEQTVFGGINIPAADAERPDELPFSADEKSIQYALTVSHETLGRTVEIDKDGTIRANAFTDMDGNPIGGGEAPTYTLPVALRSGDVQLPLTLDGAKLAVMTRGGEIELPLAA